MLDEDAKSLVVLWRKELRDKCRGAGICVDCMKEYSIGERGLCKKCMAKRQEHVRHMAKKREQWIQEGKCPQCGRPMDTNKRHCSVCLSRINESKRKLYYRRKAAGLCIRCGKNPVIEGKSFCVDCI